MKMKNRLKKSFLKELIIINTDFSRICVLH